MLFDKMRNLYLRYQQRVFIGPMYEGFFGKFRLFLSIADDGKPGIRRIRAILERKGVRDFLLWRLDGIEATGLHHECLGEISGKVRGIPEDSPQPSPKQGQYLLRRRTVQYVGNPYGLPTDPFFKSRLLFGT